MSDEDFLLASGYVDKDEETGELLINYNDVWAWALSACRPITQSQIKEVADLYRKWGWPGLLYWETLQPNGFTISEFEDNNRFIQFVKREENLILVVPDSNKRAYLKVQ